MKDDGAERRPDPCQLVWQVNEFGSFESIHRFKPTNCAPARQAGRGREREHKTVQK